MDSKYSQATEAKQKFINTPKRF